MSSDANKDGRVGSRIQNYRGFWDEKDLSKDKSVDSRVENYTEVINGEIRLFSGRITLLLTFGCI